MSETAAYQAKITDLFAASDLDQLPPGAPFDVTWTVQNSGGQAWRAGTALVTSDESHPDAAPFAHRNLAGQPSYTLPELGEAAQITAGDSAFLTITFKAPSAPGTYWTAWQLQTAAGERFGPLLELRIGVVEPLEKGLENLSYRVDGFANSFASYNNMPAGQPFSGTWTLTNDGLDPWSGDFRVRFTPQTTLDTNDATADLLGAPESSRLGDLTGRETVAPGESVQVRLQFQAPQEPGIYAFQWQMEEASGQPFGGTRWLRIVVRQADGAAPPPPSTTAAYSYQGPAVTFFTGIHGPASDWMWGDSGFRQMMQRLNMPVFFWSLGANKDNAGFGDPARNAVRLYWAPRPAAPAEAYQEIRDGELRRWWDQGCRRFVFFNEPQFDAAIAGIEEGYGIAWQSADEFGRFLKGVLQRARAEFPGIQLFTTPMSSNAAFDPWGWRKAMWSHVQGLVDGWCMHAYTGDNVNVEAAAADIAGQVAELQRRFQLQIPIIVSEASVNRGSDAGQKARVAHRLHQKLAALPGVQGVYWYAAEWDPASDHHNEGWYRTGIAEAYLQQAVA